MRASEAMKKSLRCSGYDVGAFGVHQRLRESITLGVSLDVRLIIPTVKYLLLAFAMLTRRSAGASLLADVT